MRGKIGVLTTPVFTASVALLALNDHVLKPIWPGPITGKLSDFAGVVVVAIVLSLLVGKTAAVGLTAVGFAALKAVPGVNVLAAPVLGGVTHTDPTDLMALAMLVPTFRWLRRSSREPDDTEQARWQWRRWVLGGCSLGVAVLATTATSCVPPAGVTSLVVEDDRIFASVDAQFDDYRYSSGSDVHWWVSDDGGRSWTSANGKSPRDDTARSATEACDDRGVCWRVTPGEQVDRCEPAAECIPAFRFTASQADRMRDLDTCAPARSGEFSSILLVPQADREIVVVSMGTEGVLVRNAEGDWDRRSVGHVEPTPIGVVPGSFELLAIYSPLALIAVSPLILLRLIRHRKGWAAVGFSLALVGGFALLGIAVALDFFGVRYDVLSLSITAVCVAVFGISWWVASEPDGKRSTAVPPRARPSD
jgi:hypothetical protein